MMKMAKKKKKKGVHVGVLAEGLNDGRAEGKVGHKMSGQHTKVNYIITY